MSKTLLAILAHSGAQEAITRHAPYWISSGCTLIGVGREDSPLLYWPSEFRTVDIGVESAAKGPNHPLRLIKLIDLYLSQYAEDSLCVLEYDAITLKPVPSHPGGLCTFTFDEPFPHPDGFRSFHYHHVPWWMDRYTARLILDRGRKMLHAYLYEGGFLDRWLGLMVDLYPEISVTPAPAFSRNSLDTPQYMAEARAAVKAGIVFCHGVKTKAQLEELVAP